MSNSIIQEINKELDKGKSAVIKTYRDDDLEYYEVFRNGSKLLGKLAKTSNDLTSLPEILKRDYLELVLFDKELDRIDFIRDEAV